MKAGEVEKIISDSQWLQMGRELEINSRKSDWKAVRTKVYEEIEDLIIFNQHKSTSTLFVDDCGIGKSFAARNVVKTLKNALRGLLSGKIKTAVYKASC